MAVPEDLRGPFVQVAHKLRWTKDAPPRGDTTSQRPREGSRDHGWGTFLDDPDAAWPGCTLVEFAADDAIDVAGLLASGALRWPRTDQLPGWDTDDVAAEDEDTDDDAGVVTDEDGT